MRWQGDTLKIIRQILYLLDKNKGEKHQTLLNVFGVLDLYQSDTLVDWVSLKTNDREKQGRRKQKYTQ